MKPLRILLGSLLIAILLVSALALPVWYVYSQGIRFVRDAESQARNRAVEMTITLNTLSGESLYYNNLIALSNTLETIVHQSTARSDAFQIEEIFLADRDGKLLAHSDIARVAAEANVAYDADKMHFKDVRFKGDPVGIEVTERVSADFGDLSRKLSLEPALEWALRFILPDLAASRYHVYGSVYMPDEDLPTGTLHVLIHNRNADAAVAFFAGSIFQTLGIAVLGAGILWLVFTIILAVLVFQQSDVRPGPEYPTAGESATAESELINESELEPIAAPSNVAHLDEYRSRKKGIGTDDQESDGPAEILDAVPMDRV